MAHGAGLVMLGVVVACAGCVEDDAQCNGFGCPSSADAGESATTPGSSGATTQGDDAPTTLESSGATSSADPSTTTDADGTTTSPQGSSSDTGDDTTGASCRGPSCPALGECFGVGVWQSCTQYCEAGKATCVEAGCDGATVVYYGDANACVDMQSNGESDQSCDAAFDQGGAVSFGRCCCE